MKTNFMVVASHEVRTPLTLLQGYLELLVGGYLGPDGTPREPLLVCQRAVDRIVATFTEIVEALRMTEGRTALALRETDLGQLARETLEELRPFVERRGQRTTLSLPDGPVTVVADTEKVRAIFVNLVQNAVKFTPDGGEIRVEVALETAAARVTVEDTGVGLDPADLDAVFERFFTGRDTQHHRSGTFEFEARGAGLGLAIVKGYVEAHGGRVWAESAGRGSGSRFHVRLPRAPAA